MESSLVPLHAATVLNMIEGNAFNQFPTNLEQYKLDSTYKCRQDWFITDFWKIKNFPCALDDNTLLMKVVEHANCWNFGHEKIFIT